MDKMNILFSAQGMIPPLTGIGRYATSLSRAMQQFETDIDLDYYQFGRVSKKTNNEFLLSKIRNMVNRFPALKSYLRKKYHANRGAHTIKAKNYIYHEPNYIPTVLQYPYLVTVHDLSHIINPEWHPVERVHFLSEHLPLTLEKADAIFVVSKSVKKELIHWMPEVSHKLHITYNGVDHSKFSTESFNKNILEKYHLPSKEYFLFLGTIEPRKKIEDLLTAYQMLVQNKKTSLPLIIVGGVGWKCEEILDRIKHSKNVRWLQYVPEKDLPALLAGARCMVYPSAYEGFGLPVLEAMSVGTPVITTAGGAIGEIGGLAPFYFNNGDIEGLAEHMTNLALSPECACDHITEGLIRSSYFTWDRCASRTLSTYRDVWANHY
ncbi:glycosyltransferase family 4 protein [Iodobacter fluviatilis]|uniref:Alpha-1,3-rhamnosyl/mannosyltransferase n=1 Tax=Iodobacter fluviatilis TaxID=537 RepID=A0A377SVT3_9NEIS|nr:glycosyltransferase family 1 protein [Iodobacter fluviatilis]TCU87994.1 alpha-1,3-rhamnosyl/mannosyltransferase [Iodobacter fluviatilis]STR45495.1 Capsular glucan synthase [Iodobacter fluviatilis]